MDPDGSAFTKVTQIDNPIGKQCLHLPRASMASIFGQRIEEPNASNLIDGADNCHYTAKLVAAGFILFLVVASRPSVPTRCPWRPKRS